MAVRALQAKKQDIVQVMGRVATAAEAQKVMGEVSSIQADSLQADDTLTVSIALAELASSVINVANVCRPQADMGDRLSSDQMASSLKLQGTDDV